MEVIQLFPFHTFLLIDHTKLILLLQTEEINGPSVNIREDQRQLRRSIQFLHSHPQGRFHLTLNLLLFPFYRILSPIHPTLSPKVKNDISLWSFLINEKADPTGAVGHGKNSVSLTAAYLPHIKYSLCLFVQFMNIRRRQAMIS